MSGNSNRPSKRRYKAMLEDVAKRVRYAIYSGDDANPYPADDKRYERFAKQLVHARWMDADFRDMCEITGTDTSGWKLRHHPKPGPVVPMERLI
jgi:hypothetical protein